MLLMTVHFEDTDPRPKPEISEHDLAVLEEFRAALKQPTRHRTLLAILRMDADNPETAAALAAHDAKCCTRCDTHVMPHNGCILR